VTAIVISYSNPDLDGVACAIGLAHQHKPVWSPHVLGDIDSETRTVLRRLGLTVPPAPPAWTDIDRIWLVDTHHPNQLPTDFPYNRVVRITDHHPGGAPEHFPNAEIENESVGAAATLVAEQMVATVDTIPVAIARLLQAAILSNTLDFNAPSTSVRDQAMFAHLRKIAPLPSDVIEAMAEARRSRLNMSSLAILESDVKSFDTPLGRITIAQVECGGALGLLDRRDLLPSLVQLRASHEAVAAILNLVDLDRNESALLGTDVALIAHISAQLGVESDANGKVRIDRLLQRKSDIVPHLS
jgi:manganese-dependent inorganic pyrophosphatase